VIFLGFFYAFPIENIIIVSKESLLKCQLLSTNFCDWQMSPSRSIKHDSLSHSGDAAVLQKLEEVGSSVKVKKMTFPKSTDYIFCYLVMYENLYRGFKI